MNNKLVYSIIFLAIFLFFLIGGVTNLDKAINLNVTNLQNSLFADIFRAIDLLFDIVPVSIASIVIAGILYLKKSRKTAVFFALTMLVSAGVIYLVKEIVERARPENALIAISDSSFPSGHTTTAIVFFGLLVYLAIKSKKSYNFKLTTGIISIFMMAVISFSRVYLGVHWLSDVLGGISLGLFILLGSIGARENLF